MARIVQHIRPTVVEPLEKGGYRARLAQSEADLNAAHALRTARFRPGHVGSLDQDALDDQCRHVLVERRADGALMATFRFMHLANGRGIDHTYSAQFYGLSKLTRYEKPVVEMGRFCTAEGAGDVDALRVGWALLTRYVDAHRVGLIIGCSSFPGTATEPFCDALALLKERHLAPDAWRPQVKAPQVVPFAKTLSGVRPSLRKAQKTLPPLLRAYLTMGGWVSDHAVIDPDLRTFHVFTGVEVSKIPPVRARLLRAAAA
ncbi:MAG: GNAT family N-acyltransferase [Pseudomonadota bacterium]